MSERFLLGFRRWDETYGPLVVWLWRLILYPLLAISLYAGKAYLDSHYVSKEYFDKAMAILAEEKQRFALDQKQDLKEINVKLDTLLQVGAANGQRLTDAEHRISRLENKSDGKHN